MSDGISYKQKFAKKVYIHDIYIYIYIRDRQPTLVTYFHELLQHTP